MIAPQFASVGKDGKFNLQDFTGSGEDASWCIFLDILDAFGGLSKQYIWVEDHGENGDQKCWVDGSNGEPPEIPVCFEPGQAFWVEAQNDTQRIQSSGEVPVKDAKVQLCDGATMCGNFTPTKMALQDILVEGEGVSWEVFLDILDNLGGLAKQYIWVEDYGENGDQKCWVDGSNGELPGEPVYFNAGQAFWVEAQNANQFITFPGVEFQEGK